MRVLFFAQLKDATGCESAEFSVPSELTAGQLWNLLIGKFPALASYQKQVRLSRNWVYAEERSLFENGDEVALIPPVSGG